MEVIVEDGNLHGINPAGSGEGRARTIISDNRCLVRRDATAR
jgi:hypothetical protein